MPRDIGATIVKLLIASLVVGWLMAACDVTPDKLLHDFWGTIQDVFGWAIGFAEQNFSYVVLGAVVVVPIWALFWGINYLRGRR